MLNKLAMMIGAGLSKINFGFVLFVVGLVFVAYGFFLLSFVAGIFAVGIITTVVSFIVDGATQASKDNQ